MNSQSLEERMVVIEEIYQDFVGFGLNSHFPAPSVGLFPEELKRLIWCELENPNRNSVVLGSHNGGAELVLGLVKQYKKDTSHIFSVDIKFSDFYELSRKRLKQKTGIELVKWEINSAEFGEVYHDFTSDNLGLVLIDSFHSFRHAYHEFLGIKDLMVENGLVLFHDTSPAFPKKGIYYEEDLINDTSENFYIDECMSFIIDKHSEYTDYRIPICETMNRSRETQIPKWKRGTTSPEMALFALQYNERY